MNCREALMRFARRIRPISVLDVKGIVEGMRKGSQVTGDGE